MAVNGPMNSGLYGWGGDATFEEFEKAANASNWAKTLRLGRNRSFIGNGAYTMRKKAEGDHPGAYLTDTTDSEGNVVWKDKTANNYVLSPNELRNLNAYLLKYSPELHENSNYPTPFEDDGLVSTEDFDPVGFNLSDKDMKKYKNSYKDYVKTKYKLGGYIKYFR